MEQIQVTASCEVRLYRAKQNSTKCFIDIQWKDWSHSIQTNSPTLAKRIPKVPLCL